MALTTLLVVMLAAMSSCVTAETTCGPCKCYDGDHRYWYWKGLKVADCISLPTLTSVPASLPADIQVLNIYGCPITTLAESQFISYRHLQKIIIDYSKISQIKQGAFRYLTNVTYIDLKVNEITELPSDFLEYTPNINKVWISHNKIKQLQTNLFSNLKYLKTVFLHNNEITTIEDHCFNNVPQLEDIQLYNNQLISLDVNFIDNINSLKYLHLYNNTWHCDASLCGVLDAEVRGALWGYNPVPACTTPLILTGRRWSKELQTELCPCFQCQCTVNPSAALCSEPRQLNHVPTDLPTDLVQLNLTGQQISVLKESDIIRYRRLQGLYLENNNIQTLEVPVFKQLNYLTTLSLRNNNLTALKTRQFANLPELNAIDVSQNNISLIEVDSFFNLSSLETVNLSSNKLKQLSVNFIDEPSKLKTVFLYGNPWLCDESLCELKDLVVRRALWGAEVVPTCAAPADLRGKHWNRVADAFQPQITSNTTSVVEGHDLVLKCKHCFLSRLFWTFNDVQLPSNYEYESSGSLTSTLIIKNILKEQHGYYLCRVRNCEDCKNAGLYVSVSGKTQSDFDVKQVLHVPDVNSNESCSSRSGLLLLHYTVAPTTELNTTHNDGN